MKIIFPILLAMLLVMSCQETNTQSNGELTEVIFEPDSSDTIKIFIRDKTGKKWDITHAVNKYGFDPERFQHGLGPYAITPIRDPRFLSPGDSEYDSIDENEMVIGVFLYESVKAYSLKILKSHEIVDEKFGPTYVAVGY